MSFGEIPLVGGGDFECFAVASNTAHLYAFLVKSLTGLFGEFIDLAERNAQLLAKQSPGRVLILGTTRAAEGQLYQNYFRQFQVSYQMPRHQSRYQHFIDQTKRGERVDRNYLLAHLFEDLSIHQNASNACTSSLTAVSHVFLACTELQEVFDETVIAALKQHGITLVDSQQLFADHLVSELLELQQKYQATGVRYRFLGWRF